MSSMICVLGIHIPHMAERATYDVKSCRLSSTKISPELYSVGQDIVYSEDWKNRDMY